LRRRSFSLPASRGKEPQSVFDYADVEFLFRHDLGYLLDLCKSVAPEFAALESQIVGLTPYAVEMRYPADLPLTPTREDVEQFYHQAQTVYEFVASRCAD
jgi:hypothetical protein